MPEGHTKIVKNYICFYRILEQKFRKKCSISAVHSLHFGNLHSKCKEYLGGADRHTSQSFNTKVKCLENQTERNGANLKIKK